MKLLLDTHCLIWLLTDAPQLDAQAQHGGYQLPSIDRTLAGFGAEVVKPKSR